MPDSDNHLITQLPRQLAQRLRRVGEQVELLPSSVLHEAHGEVQYVYFPIEGWISLLTPVDGHPDLEVAQVGREGMLGEQIALGVAQAPLRARVQTVGVALRIATLDFRRALLDNEALQELLGRYQYVRMAQLALSAGCQRHHLIGQRLARWLLMSQDRTGGAPLHVTHEVLAGLLGVRRVGITVAASTMQRQGLIRYRRGELTVLNRSGLEAAACTCYAFDGQAYTERLG